MKYAIEVVLLICILSINSAFGQYPVGMQSLTISDPSRPEGLFGTPRDIPFDLYYPATAGGTNTPIAPGWFPFVSFGHGFAMSVDEYGVWQEKLASSGYIVVFPLTETGILPFPDHADFAEDLSFLINYFLQENQDPASPFYQKLNGKSAVMGHSMGGGASFTSAATNPAITTLVTLAAAETNNVSAIGNAALLTQPSLTLAGSADCVVLNGGAPIDMYNNVSNNSVYRAYIEITNGSHCQFSDTDGGSLCTLGEFCSGFISLADQHLQMCLAVEPWLAYWLKGDCAAWQQFQNHLTTSTAHTFLDGGALPIISNPLPMAGFTQAGNQLSAFPSGTYQWFQNDVPIPGATNQQLTIGGPGNYAVEVTDVNGCASRSDQNVFLAVDLLSFDVVQIRQEVMLSWAMAGSLSIPNFEIQRSVDGIRFESLGQVFHPTTQTPSVNQFSYTDPFPEFGLNYYRLKMTEEDNEISFSNVKVIRMPTNPEGSILVRYRMSSGLLVTFPYPVQHAVQFKIYSLDGKKILDHSLQINGPKLVFPLPGEITSRSGWYILQVSGFASELFFIP